MSNFVITTERLILRHPTMHDAQIITEGKQAVWPELQAWMKWAYDGEETLEATKNFIGNLGVHSLIGLRRDSGKFVVMTGLTPLAPDEYETGYWVTKDFLGKGYATEATCAAMHFAFAALNAKKIHIGHFEGNTKSRRVIEKLGFSNEVIKPKDRKCIVGDRYQDSHDFSMTDPSMLPDIQYDWRGRWSLSAT